MAASLRNFFITFILSLMLFGGLAYSYYGDLEALLPVNGNKPSVSEGESEPSDSVSDPDNIVIGPEDTGDGLGMINGLIVTKGVKGDVLRATFLRINSENRKVISCDLSLQASLYNRIGVLVPLEDFLNLYPIAQAMQSVCALTGYSADFFLIITPDIIESMSSNLDGLSLPLRQTIRYPNPIYDGYEFEEGELLPQDYYLDIGVGTNLFSDGVLSTILGPYAAAYEARPSNVQGQNPDEILEELYTYLIGQLNGEKKSEMKNDLSRLANALSGGETNLTASYLSGHADLLFKYGESNYRHVSVPYTTRDATLHDIKQEDQ